MNRTLSVGSQLVPRTLNIKHRSGTIDDEIKHLFCVLTSQVGMLFCCRFVPSGSRRDRY